jgi:hypothetical protein
MYSAVLFSNLIEIILIKQLRKYDFWIIIFYITKKYKHKGSVLTTTQLYASFYIVIL